MSQGLVCVRLHNGASRPPESGGQRDETERRRPRSRNHARGGFRSRTLAGFANGTSPRATPSGRAALLTQEGVARSPVEWGGRRDEGRCIS